MPKLRSSGECYSINGDPKDRPGRDPRHECALENDPPRFGSIRQTRRAIHVISLQRAVDFSFDVRCSSSHVAGSRLNEGHWNNPTLARGVFISDSCTTAGLGGLCYRSLSGAERSGRGVHSITGLLSASRCLPNNNI